MRSSFLGVGEEPLRKAGPSLLQFKALLHDGTHADWYLLLISVQTVALGGCEKGASPNK